MTWDALDLDGSPVQGDPSEFLSLSACFASMGGSLTSLHERFRSVAGGTSVEFQGDSADAVRGNFRAVLDTLADAPRVTSEVERVLSCHGRRLDELQQRAREALARAETRWNDQQAAMDDRQAWHRELACLEEQLGYLDGLESPDLTSRRDEAERRLDRAEYRVRQASEEVGDSRTEWHQLRDEEEELNSATCAALREVDLYSLADPSLLQQLGDLFGDLVKYVWSTEFLKAIYACLDAALLVLAVIAAVVVIVTIVCGTGGFAVPGIVAGAAAIVPVITASAAATKLTVGAELFRRDELSLGQLLRDGVEAGLALAAVPAVAKLGKQAVKSVTSGSSGLQKVIQATARSPVGQAVGSAGGYYNRYLKAPLDLYEAGSTLLDAPSKALYGLGLDRLTPLDLVEETKVNTVISYRKPSSIVSAVADHVIGSITNEDDSDAKETPTSDGVPSSFDAGFTFDFVPASSLRSGGHFEFRSSESVSAWGGSDNPTHEPVGQCLVAPAWLEEEALTGAAP